MIEFEKQFTENQILIEKRKNEKANGRDINPKTVLG